MSEVTVNAISLDVLSKNGQYELKVNSKASAKIGSIDIKEKREKDKEKEMIAKKIEVIDGDKKVPVFIDDEELEKMNEEEEKEINEEEKQEVKEEKSIDDILNSGDDMLI